MLLVLALAPGTWLRSQIDETHSDTIEIASLPFEHNAQGPFRLEGLWEISKESLSAGGYSAIAVLGQGEYLRLYSDRGWALNLPSPDRREGPITQRRFYPGDVPLIEARDVESAAYHPETRQFWLAFEDSHILHRFAQGGDPEAFIKLPFARLWSANSGIEAMLRLRDGRFLLLKESQSRGPAFLFDGDPVETHRVQTFHVRYPEGYSPTDMAQLPDGRVLVVLRRVAFASPVFEAMIGIADPAEIGAEEDWQITPLAQLEDLVPRENYEAIAVHVEDDGALSIWLASDDNFSVFQRSLLAKFSWHADLEDAEIAQEKGRQAEAGAPSSS